MIQVNRIYLIFNRLVTKKFLVDTSDLPQEIKETMVTEVTYLPITRERLEQFFKDAASKRKPKLVKKRKQLRQQGS